MNRNLLIAAVVIVLIIIGAGAFMLMGNKDNSSTTANPQNTQPTQAENPGILSSIKDAFTSGQSIECDYTDSEGKRIVAYMKGGQVRTDITAANPAQSGSMIMKDKKLYTWNAQGGTVIDIPDVSVTPGQGTTSSTDETLDRLEGYKQFCKQASVGDDKFEVPTDVKFQNMSSLMQQSLPTGTDRAQVEELMKKYLSPTP